jgi:hypothetical protein
MVDAWFGTGVGALLMHVVVHCWCILGVGAWFWYRCWCMIDPWLI